MRFDFGSLSKFILVWFSHLGWSLRQVLIAVVFVVAYPLLQLCVWSAFLMDELFYRGYRKQPVQQPVFIVGMFRSGTTLLHRLLAKDSRFNTMMMWEILFAPAIVQRKILGWCERALGDALKPVFDRLHKNWQQKNPMHQVNLHYPEEDDYLLLHRWSTLTAGLSSGELELARPYLRFDQDVIKRAEIMRFYELCVKKHLYSHRNEGPVYLAKNPALTPKLQSLFTQFPDAKVVFIVRNPLEVIPSFLSMMQFSWKVIGTRQRKEMLRDFLWDMAKHWYRYPLQQLAGRDPSSYAIIRYDDLIHQPEATIRELYRKMQWPLTEKFTTELCNESKEIASYQTRHQYDLQSLGLNRELILQEFDDIFQRFDFTRQPHISESKQHKATNFALH